MIAASFDRAVRLKARQIIGLPSHMIPRQGFPDFESGRLFSPAGPFPHDAAPRTTERESRELQLLRRSAGGDREAFGDLYDCYAKPLYSYVLRIVHDRTQAEAVLLEVFVTLWRNAPLFDVNRGEPFVWALRITRDKTIAHLRGLKRRRRREGGFVRLRKSPDQPGLRDLRTDPEGPDTPAA